MGSHLLDREGTVQPRLDRAAIESRLSSGEFFWLDLHSPGEEEFQLLRDVFRFHPLAIEDSEQFGQRAKIEDFGDFVFIVFFGASPPPDQDRLVEVHCFYSDRFLVTIRQDEAPACDALRDRYAKRPAPLERPIVLLYRLLNELSDSFFPALEDLDGRIDELQDEMLGGPTDAQLQEMFAMRRTLVYLRRAVTPQRDLSGELARGLRTIPDLDEEAGRYFRDIYDHLIRVSDMIDSYRDLLSSAMDVYLSTVSNRLNVEMKRLTVIATIALPLIVISGFFGQNFGFLVRHIDSLWSFLVLGVGMPLVLFALLMVYLRRRHVV
ncbi:MAG TPA: magnesium transporter CorA family protein [Gaiellaceae bacterium]|jgi:magnesium transporter|nr:magnesium transporter CorA family protein [Gaiellaceae bacterium]